MNQPPISVLAGWCARPEQWKPFSKEWEAILRMRPRIEHFKFAEAMSLRGQFAGVSERSRNEKITLLVSLIEEFNLLGVTTIILHDAFHRYFGKKAKGAMRTPYAISFVQIIGRLHRHLLSQEQPLERIDFVFDTQKDQLAEAMKGWAEFTKDATNDVRPMIGNLSFDTEVLPLQAADLHAGWVRQLNMAELRGEEIPIPPWGKRGDGLFG